MIIYLVRHLKTEFNKSGVYMGRSFNPPILQESGGSFVTRLKRVVPQGLEKTAPVFSSPSLRCQQTAEALEKALGLVSNVEISEELCEADYGNFEGKNIGQIKEEYPDLYKVWIDTPSRITFPGGGSLKEAAERSFTEFLRITSTYSSEKQLPIFIVTHVDVIKAIICQILGVSLDKKSFFRVDPGSINCLEDWRRSFRVNYLNYL